MKIMLGRDLINVNVLLRKVIRFLRKKNGVKYPNYATTRPQRRYLDQFQQS